MSGTKTMATLAEMMLTPDTAQSPTGKYCPHTFRTPVGDFKFGVEDGQLVALYTAKDVPVQFDLTMFGVTRPIKGSGRYILGLADVLKGSDDNIGLWVQIKSPVGDYNSSLKDGAVRLKV